MRMSCRIMPLLLCLILSILCLLFFTGMAHASTFYTVKPGDTLYKIGLKYNTTPKDIKNASHITSNSIIPGQILTLPVNGVVYRVRSGDTLFKIAQNYNISVNSIQQANKYWKSTVYPGQVFWLPVTSSKLPNNTYRVRQNDSLFKIAQKFGVTQNSLKATNGLQSNTIYTGQILRIPTTPATTQNNVTRATSSSRGAGSYNDDLMLLAQVVHAEARGEPYVGKVAVAAVVLNRVKSPKFPNSIKGVVYQPWAFTAVNDGQLYLKPDSIAIRAAREALGGWDPSGGALFYWNPAKSTNSWVWNRIIVNRIGNHIFAI